MLRPDELLHSIQSAAIFAGYRQYIRKVGTRNAQAISKIALAALAKMDGDVVVDIRLERLRWRAVRFDARQRKRLFLGGVDAVHIEAIVRAARAALAAEAKPIDDIRSTAKYRAAVAANLLEEFLRSLVSESLGRGTSF